jgi:hypothetical protein
LEIYITALLPHHWPHSSHQHSTHLGQGLRRFAELALRYEAATKKLARENLDKDRPAPKASKFNQRIAPLATINNDFQLRWSDEVYEELSRQELERYIKYGRYGPPEGASS